MHGTTMGGGNVFIINVIFPNYFRTLPRTWDLTCEMFTLFFPTDIHSLPSPPTFLYPFTLSASVVNRITTDRCALWQLTASICSKRMHRKLANMSRKRNRKNVIADIFHSSFHTVFFGVSISLLIVSITLVNFCLFVTYPSFPTHVY